MILANGLIYLEFDDNTGALRQIQDRKTGKKHLQDPRAHRLVKLIAPTPECSTRPLFSHTPV